ncbi:MAG: hypothetical protein ACP5O1_09510 [Phycisphaerae bacterium]
MDISSSTRSTSSRISRRLTAASAVMLLLVLPGCVTHVIKNNSISAQLNRATGGGQGWYVTTNSKSSNANSQGGFTPHKPGNFIFDPSEPGQ